MSTNTETKALAKASAVRGVGSTLTALVSGSMVLAGRICHCAGRALSWAWEQASIDPAAQATVQAHAAHVAKVQAKHAKRAKAEPEDAEAEAAAAAEELKALGAAPSGRRPFLEALAYLALGGMLVAGAAAMAGALITPHLTLLTPWKPMIVSVGGLAWMVAAWMVAPAPGTTAEVAAVEDQDEEHGQEAEADRGTELLWHVVGATAAAESAGRAGLHLDTVLDSAAEAGLIPQDTELCDFRAWVEACGLPTEDKVGMRINGKPVTRVGMKLAAVTEALRMTPGALLQTRSQTPAGGAPAAPAQPVVETPAEAPASTPVEAPAEAPVPAVLRLIPGGRQDPSETAPLPLSKGTAQEAR